MAFTRNEKKKSSSTASRAAQTFSTWLRTFLRSAAVPRRCSKTKCFRIVSVVHRPSCMDWNVSFCRCFGFIDHERTADLLRCTYRPRSLYLFLLRNLCQGRRGRGCASNSDRLAPYRISPNRTVLIPTVGVKVVLLQDTLECREWVPQLSTGPTDTGQLLYVSAVYSKLVAE